MAGYSITCKQCGKTVPTPDKRRLTKREQFCSRPCFYESNKRPLEERFWKKVSKTETCWLWNAAISSNGYGKACIVKGVFEQAHRLSWQIHFGPIPDNLHVCHRCDVRNCVRPDHLFLGTRIDNMQDCAIKGRQNSKLNPEAVRAIRDRHAQGERASMLAAEFRIDKSMVHLIVKRRYWAHVT